jgi:hypothetical protein
MDLKKLVLEENVGGYDLLVRSIAGSLAITALALDWVSAAPWRSVVALIAVIGLFSGMTRHCTPYALLGISTKRR